MRDILFRGKTMDYDSKWVEGYYVHVPCGRFQCDEHMIQTVKEDDRIGQLYDVYDSTVGQFTGLTDKHGKKIFEGDMVISYSMFGDTEGCGVVAWNELFCCWEYAEHKSMYGGTVGSYEVIGNIHDGEGAA